MLGGRSCSRSCWAGSRAGSAGCSHADGPRRSCSGCGLFAAAESRRTELGYRLAIDRPGLESARAEARQALGPDDFAAAWAEGAKLWAEEAIAYAARGRGERRRPSTGWASLTPSELQVVRLVG